MGKQIKCPINQKTKEMFECSDCPIKEDCLEDICDDFREYVVKGASRLGRDISRILRERGGI